MQAVPYSVVEPEPDEPHGGLVVNQCREAAEDELSIDAVEKVVDIGIDQPDESLVVKLMHALDGHAHGAAAAVGKAAVVEFGFEERLDVGGDGGGQGRMQILDRDWVVIAQSVPAGSKPRLSQRIVLTSVKYGEPTGSSGCKSRIQSASGSSCGRRFASRKRSRQAFRAIASSHWRSSRGVTPRWRAQYAFRNVVCVTSSASAGWRSVDSAYA